MIAKAIQKLKSRFDHVSGLGHVANPPYRMELRKDFPEIIFLYNTATAITSTLEKEIRKTGDAIRQVHIAYPHKHPLLFPHHTNNAEGYTHELLAKLRTLLPETEWRIAHEICETVHLSRSENQTLLHAFTGKQLYAVSPKEGHFSPKDSIENPDTKLFAGEYFVVMDTIVASGTTMANLISFIEYHGGHVLAAVSSHHTGSLVQIPSGTSKTRDPSLPVPFLSPRRNNGKITELSKAFGKATRPVEGTLQFEKALNRHGNSLLALTNNECARLIGVIQSDPQQYPALLSALQSKMPHPLAKTPPYSPLSGM